MVESELKILTDFINGNCYWYETIKEGNVVNSCGSFYGSDHEKSGLYDCARAKLEEK